ncbi:hypothetical protein ACFV5N_23405 [Streptomyces sp. NPDC059853]|uniref:hypothetical protein n=1 Tax=Streptomyces sp. NPDC059853 TaxID=3346973 RepID=UPI00364E78C9
MSLKDAALREAVVKLLSELVAGELKAVRAEVQSGLDTAATDSGTRQIAVSLPDGTRVATISLTEPSPEATVVDEAEFVAWAREQYPDARDTRIVRDIRPWKRAELLGQMTAAGVPEVQVVDEDTGEITATHTVPGVEIRPTRARSHSVRFAKTGRDDILAAWRGGQLGAAVPPALAPAEGGAA